MPDWARDVACRRSSLEDSVFVVRKPSGEKDVLLFMFAMIQPLEIVFCRASHEEAHMPVLTPAGGPVEARFRAWTRHFFTVAWGDFCFASVLVDVPASDIDVYDSLEYFRDDVFCSNDHWPRSLDVFMLETIPDSVVKQASQSTKAKSRHSFRGSHRGVEAPQKNVAGDEF